MNEVSDPPKRCYFCKGPTRPHCNAIAGGTPHCNWIVCHRVDRSCGYGVPGTDKWVRYPA